MTAQELIDEAIACAAQYRIIPNDDPELRVILQHAQTIAAIAQAQALSEIARHLATIAHPNFSLSVIPQEKDY